MDDNGSIRALHARPGTESAEQHTQLILRNTAKHSKGIGAADYAAPIPIGLRVGQNVVQSTRVELLDFDEYLVGKHVRAHCEHA